MSTPSLLNIPYRFKAGTLYSQLPETGAGDFTVTRATTPTAGQSTRVNAAGLIETVADNVPRLDYPLGGAVNGCPALLVEPSAVNICLRSTWEGGGASPTGWSPFTSGGTSTPTTSLLGNDSVAYSFLATSQRVFFSQTITISNATNYTFSFYVESIATGVKIDEIVLFQSGASSVVFVDPDGITISATTVISKIGRYQVRMLSTATSTTIRIGIGVSGNVAGLLVLSRPQLEVGSVPTSYIPTTTAAITRGAETVSKTGVSSLIGQGEGTIYAEVDYRNFSTSSQAILHLFENGNNLIGIQTIRSGANNQFQAYAFVAGNLVVSITSTISTAGVYKIALAYKLNDYALYINGTLIGVDSIAGVPTTSQVLLGHYASQIQFNDRIRAAAIYPTRIPNTAAPGVLSLATLTTP